MFEHKRTDVPTYLSANLSVYVVIFNIESIIVLTHVLRQTRYSGRSRLQEEGTNASFVPLWSFFLQTFVINYEYRTEKLHKYEQMYVVHPASRTKVYRNATASNEKCVHGRIRLDYVFEPSPAKVISNGTDGRFQIVSSRYTSIHTVIHT